MSLRALVAFSLIYSRVISVASGYSHKLMDFLPALEEFSRSAQSVLTSAIDRFALDCLALVGFGSSGSSSESFSFRFSRELETV